LKLKLSMGKTINIGQYESLRVDVGTEHDIDFQQFDSELEAARNALSDQLRELEKFMRLTHSDRAIP
jgi:hypothetical protein